MAFGNNCKSLLCGESEVRRNVPVFQEANPEPGNRVSGRVSARVFLQGFEGPYGWECGSLTAAKQGTSLQSAAPSGVAHPPTWRGPVGLRTGWLGNQQLSFPQPGKDRRGAEDGKGPRCPGPPPLTGGCRVPPGH